MPQTKFTEHKGKEGCDDADAHLFRCTVIFQIPVSFYHQKDLQTHSKGGTDYILVVSHNGQKMEMEVSQSEYYHYEVGDKLPVTFYEGFFKKAYYIAE